MNTQNNASLRTRVLSPLAALALALAGATQVATATTYSNVIASTNAIAGAALMGDSDLISAPGSVSSYVQAAPGTSAQANGALFMTQTRVQYDQRNIVSSTSGDDAASSEALSFEFTIDVDKIATLSSKYTLRLFWGQVPDAVSSMRLVNTDTGEVLVNDIFNTLAVRRYDIRLAPGTYAVEYNFDSATVGTGGFQFDTGFAMRLANPI
ncbi:MAG: hypothetical protein DWH96_09985 [Planctomycetota bacterium]|nr:MAG: hypothetical protein DWH96_09985 [Planctomycetota bacterium]